MSEILVKLRIYEGPLDLLLHLIKKNEVDLNDIPVALITAQYLEYLDLMESMNVEVAADFLVMAATLTQIKSRLLLPREDDPDSEDEIEDELKAAILDPILEHLRFRGFKDFKEAALALRTRPILGSDVFARGLAEPAEEFTEQEVHAGETLLEASLFDLVDAFRRLSERRQSAPTLRFVVEPKTLAQRILEIQAFLRNGKSGRFADLCQGDLDHGELILSFLAVLELARTGFLRLHQDLESSPPELSIFLANPDAEVGDLEALGY